MYRVFLSCAFCNLIDFFLPKIYPVRKFFFMCMGKPSFRTLFSWFAYIQNIIGLINSIIAFEREKKQHILKYSVTLCMISMYVRILYDCCFSQLEYKQIRVIGFPANRLSFMGRTQTSRIRGRFFVFFFLSFLLVICVSAVCLYHLLFHAQLY